MFSLKKFSALALTHNQMTNAVQRSVLAEEMARAYEGFSSEMQADSADSLVRALDQADKTTVTRILGLWLENFKRGDGPKTTFKPLEHYLSDEDTEALSYG